MYICFQTILIAFLCAFSLAAAHAQESKLDDDDAIITLSYENDIFVGKDSNYTSGVRASYFSPEGDIPQILKSASRVVPIFPRTGHSRWGFAVGQNMYTPTDIRLVNPPTDDQPYAGWLYGSATLITDSNNVLDTFQVTAGMVGPASGAERTQKFIHRHITDSPDPKGWDYQLDNEPGLILTYQRTCRNMYQMSPLGLGFDLSPSVGANVGNIYTDAGMSFVGRIGKDLPSDYGPPLIRPSLGGSDFFQPNGFGWYLFAGLEGHAVARNIFLDGNTFHDSRHVEKEPFFGGAQAGIAFTFPKARVAYTHVIRTDEFETQRKTTQYGAVTVSVRF